VVQSQKRVKDDGLNISNIRTVVVLESQRIVLEPFQNGFHSGMVLEHTRAFQNNSLGFQNGIPHSGIPKNRERVRTILCDSMGFQWIPPFSFELVPFQQVPFSSPVPTSPVLPPFSFELLPFSCRSRLNYCRSRSRSTGSRSTPFPFQQVPF